MIGFLDRWYFELKRKKIRDNQGLWVNSFFRQLAYSLMGVFAMIFVFIYGRGNFLSGGVVNGLLLVLLFLLVLRIFVFLLVIWVGQNVVKKIGYRKSVILSILTGSGAFLSLAAVDRFGGIELIFLSAVLFAITNCTYWVTYYVLFLDDSEEKHMGTAFGALQVTSNIGQAAAPFVGALVALMFGFPVLFLVGIVILLVSGIPVLFLPNHLHLDDVSWGEFFSWAKEKTFLRVGTAMGGKVMSDLIYDNLWPVYVFLLVGGLKGVGLLRSVVLLATAVFTYLVAKIFDKRSDKKIQVLGVSGGVIFWVLRLMVGSLGQVLAIDGIDRFFYSMTNTFFSGYLFRRAKGPETFSFVIYRELWISIWAIGFYSLLALVLVLFGVSYFWVVAFALGALGLILSLLVREHK